MYTAKAKIFFGIKLKGGHRPDRSLASKRIAEVLGITKGAVSQWGEIVPEVSAYKLNRISFNNIPLIVSHYEKR